MAKIVGDTSVLAGLLHGDVSSQRPRRYIVVGPSGGKAGYLAALIQEALAARGVAADMFDIAVGTSAGFLNLVGYCAGQAAVTPLIYRHLARTRWVLPSGSLQHITFYDYLHDILVGGIIDGVKLDVEAFGKCRTLKLAAVSTLRGEIRYHEVDETNVFKAVHAAAAIMPFSFGVSMGDHVAIDGAYAHAHCQFARIVHKAMRNGGPGAEVCVLLLGNRPGVDYLRWGETYAHMLGVMATLWWSPRLLRSALLIDRKIAQSERLFKRPERKRTRLCAIVPEPGEEITPVEWRESVLLEKGERLLGSLEPQLDAL